MGTFSPIKYDCLPTFIKEAIDKEVKAFAEKEFEIAKKQAIEKIEKYKDTVIVGVILHVQKHMSIENYGEELRITIIKQN